jgi:hypothetical protein
MPRWRAVDGTVSNRSWPPWKTVYDAMKMLYGAQDPWEHEARQIGPLTRQQKQQMAIALERAYRERSALTVH